MITKYFSFTKPKEPDTYAFRVVISETGSQYTPYATHLENIDENGKSAGKYWGHYHTNLNEAIDDFMERCRRYNLPPLGNLVQEERELLGA